MEYRRFANTIVARIDKGEEILEKIREIAAKEHDFTVGVYKVDEKKYYANSFQGSFEIVSLTGTINTMNGEFYTHIHMSAGNDQGQVFGGHLNSAVISATAEIFVRTLCGAVGRRFDEGIGLNLLDFEK